MTELNVVMIYTCRLHHTSQLENVASCCCGILADDTYFHSVILKSQIIKEVTINPQNCVPIRNSDQSYKQYFELIPCPLACAIKDLQPGTNESILNGIVGDLFYYFYTMHEKRLINKILFSGVQRNVNGVRNFIENVCTIGVTQNPIFLFRHCVECVQDNNKNNQRLKRQSLTIVDIISELFFRASVEQGTYSKCPKNKCKFRKKFQYFSNFNYEIFHSTCYSNGEKITKSGNERRKLFQYYLNKFVNDQELIDIYTNVMDCQYSNTGRLAKK